MKKLIFITLFILLSFSISFADTHTASSCSVADIETKYGEAHSGDTVAFSGECTWASTLTLTKPITLDGTGATITHNNGTSPLILISPTTQTDFIRITGIYFENTDYIGTTRTDISWGTNSTNFRIDHNTFHNGKAAIEPNGTGTKRMAGGLIDTNTFIDVDLAIRIADDADYNNARPTTSSWGRTIAAGTSDAVFVENNTFTHTNRANCVALNESVYHYNAARSVVRYNTVNNSCAAGGDAVFDAHGKPGSDRGTVLVEMYNNAVTYSAALNRWINFRGGSLLFYNNTITTGSGTPLLNFTNEYGWSSAHTDCPAQGTLFANCDTSWPSFDQVNNSFVWNNTRNGSAVTDVDHFYATTDDVFIQKDRDYFMAAPASSGGKESYYTSNGVQYTLGAEQNPANPMTFSSSGANAYYPYTTYKCPHPLVDPTSVLTCNSTTGTTGYGVRGITPTHSGTSFSGISLR